MTFRIITIKDDDSQELMAFAAHRGLRYRWSMIRPREKRDMVVRRVSIWGKRQDVVAAVLRFRV